MTGSLTLFDKIWNAHVIVREGAAALLWIDRHLLHEGDSRAFDLLAQSGRKLRRPDLTFGTADRFVSSSTQQPRGLDLQAPAPVAKLRANAKIHAFDTMDLTDPRRGIVHVIGPEQGLILPGLTVACADSHTSTHGAFGCLALGIGTTEAAHILATQTLWRRRPRLMRITVKGTRGPFVSAKDLILGVVARIGSAGAAGHAIEFAGRAVTDLSMEGRMTLCNMAVEAGGWTALVTPDETTFAWLRARPRGPHGRAWDSAVSDWRKLTSDPDARFDAEVLLDAATVPPLVTWGTSPDTALPVTDRVPDPALAPNATAADHISSQLAAMGLVANQKLEGLKLDRVFIGSCTNGRIEDLREAAAILRGRPAVIPGLVVSGSVPVKRQAEREGLDRVFTAAGLVWGEPGCSGCIGLNGDVVPPGERCAATTSRNFVGRQGPGSRTHLMSPAMAAAAAITGMIADVRKVAT
jgi:3-isopropylmalate/(R)-2-methylmalate dehydratase large subunit